ncbi:MAG TPA: DotA/TraY family protein, partial [Micavibrio sp.]
IPTTLNLNAAQYITLHVAKFGSAFGSNFWSWFVQEVGPSSTPLGNTAQLVARPQYPGPTDLLQFFATVHTCKIAYKVMYDIDINAYLVREPLAVPPNWELNAALPALTSTGKPYYSTQEWFGFGDITVAFGEYDPANPNKHQDFRGKVRPYCGEITLPTVRVANPAGGNVFQDGADFISHSYLLYLIWQPWLGTALPTLTFDEMAVNIAMRMLSKKFDPALFGCPGCTGTLPTSTEIQDTADWYASAVKGIVDQGYIDMTSMTDWTNPAMAYGWAGAAIWYNRMVEVNGDFTDAVFNLPLVTKYPEIQEWIQEARAKENMSVTGANRFEPTLRNRDIKFSDAHEKEILKAMNQTYALWGGDPNIKPEESQNIVVDAINTVFQKSGLWSFQQNEAVHPLAGLIALGRSMLTHSVMAFAGGTALGVIPLLGAKGLLADAASGLSSAVLTIAYVGLSVGIILYYVVPFLPFIYFFFAVATWAKTIFEAMVGIPLWALAHLRYDGEGLPTRQSMFGYYLLVDIFLRPALTVFGLIASGVIFYALARTLNNTFDLVVSNLSGFDEATAKTLGAAAVGSLNFNRGPIDQMAFTLIYTVVVYMMGMSCFKLIDQIPNNALRSMGAGISTFASMIREDSGQRVSGAYMTGARLTGDEISGL